MRFEGNFTRSMAIVDLAWLSLSGSP